MTKCDGCGKEVGNLYCGHCREDIETKGIKPEEKEKLIPLLYWHPEFEAYVIACQCKHCPCNRDGICSTPVTLFQRLIDNLHPFDGDNCFRQVCG